MQMAAQTSFHETANWKRRSLWTGCPLDGRRTYVTPLTETEFLAYGVHAPEGRLVFVIRGTIRDDLELFDRQMRQARATVALCYRTVLGDSPLPGLGPVEQFAMAPPLTDGLPVDPPDPTIKG